MPDYEKLLNQHFASTEEAMATFIEVYKDAGKYADSVRKDAKRRIEEIITETGKFDWATPKGKVVFPKPSVVVRWNTKDLEALCEALPELKKLIWHLRTEEERPGSMTIK